MFLVVRILQLFAITAGISLVQPLPQISNQSLFLLQIGMPINLSMLLLSMEVGMLLQDQHLDHLLCVEIARVQGA